ncbi:hypothetical protein H0E87_031534, partial [Populus deltoides]
RCFPGWRGIRPKAAPRDSEIFNGCITGGAWIRAQRPLGTREIISRSAFVTGGGGFGPSAPRDSRNHQRKLISGGAVDWRHPKAPRDSRNHQQAACPRVRVDWATQAAPRDSKIISGIASRVARRFGDPKRPLGTRKSSSSAASRVALDWAAQAPLGTQKSSTKSCHGW